MKYTLTSPNWKCMHIHLVVHCIPTSSRASSSIEKLVRIGACRVTALQRQHIASAACETSKEVSRDTCTLASRPEARPGPQVAVLKHSARPLSSARREIHAKVPLKLTNLFSTIVHLRPMLKLRGILKILGSSRQVPSNKASNPCREGLAPPLSPTSRMLSGGGTPKQA